MTLDWHERPISDAPDQPGRQGEHDLRQRSQGRSRPPSKRARVLARVPPPGNGGPSSRRRAADKRAFADSFKKVMKERLFPGVGAAQLRSRRPTKHPITFAPASTTWPPAEISAHRAFRAGCRRVNVLVLLDPGHLVRASTARRWLAAGEASREEGGRRTFILWALRRGKTPASEALKRWSPPRATSPSSTPSSRPTS